ncbi:hypothetical protein BBP40_011190 [Aspergillus hancockii]|nr:hypothetical protein BBP40_011190 [Aspergillus hancockii]
MVALDVESLERNGITFSSAVMGLQELRESLGSEAEILAEGLLDFRGVPTRKTDMVGLASDMRYRLSEEPIQTMRSSTRIKEKEEARNIRRKAERARKVAMKIAVASEDRWIDLAKNYLFDEMIRGARQSEGSTAVGAKDLMEKMRMFVAFSVLDKKLSYRQQGLYTVKAIEVGGAPLGTF